MFPNNFLGEMNVTLQGFPLLTQMVRHNSKRGQEDWYLDLKKTFQNKINGGQEDVRKIARCDVA